MWWKYNGSTSTWTRKKARIVYLPKGNKWVDYWTKEIYDGGQYIIKETPIDICPIYIKYGSIIPNYPELNYIGEKDVDTLTLDLYLDKDSEIDYIHYQDDNESFKYREGIFNLYKIYIENKENLNIKIDLINDKYGIKYNKLKFIINDYSINEVFINKEKVFITQEGNKAIFEYFIK